MDVQRSRNVRTGWLVGLSLWALSGCALLGYDPSQDGAKDAGPTLIDSQADTPTSSDAGSRSKGSGSNAGTDSGTGGDSSQPSTDQTTETAGDDGTTDAPDSFPNTWTSDAATPDLNPDDGFPTSPLPDTGSLPPVEPTDPTNDPDEIDADAADAGVDEEPVLTDDAGVIEHPANDPLLHRYSFSGFGTTATDSVGTADGSIRGGAYLWGLGKVNLDGDDDYVDLPNGLLSSLSDTTIVAWFSWTSDNDCSVRVFDFGSSTMGEDQVDSPEYSVFYSPLVCIWGWTYALARYDTPVAEQTSSIYDYVPETDKPIQIAVVVDSERQMMRYYLDGAYRDYSELTWPLSDLKDVNNWLGRSQWADVPTLDGQLDEFRIYGSALTSAEIQALYELGPDALP